MARCRTAAIIAAAGSSTRMGGKKSKVLMNLEGKSVIWRTVAAFDACEFIDEIIVVAREEDITAIWGELSGISKVKSVINGGSTRTESTLAGLAQVSSNIDLVAFHDGARPLVTPQLIEGVILDAVTYGGSVAAIPMTDTVKRGNERDFVEETIPRDMLWRVQTPQVFRTDEFRAAVEAAGDRTFTDDSAFIEAAGGKIHIFQGRKDNIKLTTPDDIASAVRIIKSRKAEENGETVC